MAYSRQGELLTEAHRLAQIEISRQVLAQLLAMWPLVSSDDFYVGRSVWVEAATAAVTSGAVRSANAARIFYERFREHELADLIAREVVDAGRVVITPSVSRRDGPTPAGVSPVGAPRSTRMPPAVTSRGVTDARSPTDTRGPVVIDVPAIAVRLDRAGPGSLDQLTAEGHTNADKVALTRVLESAQREVLQPGRRVVNAMVAADKRAGGYARVTSGNACAFCVMLASRGPVYSDATGDFDSHGSCACQPEPQFDRGGAYNLPPSTFAAAEQWDAYKKDRKDNPERYEGVWGPKTHGDDKGVERSASESNALGFRRFLEGRGPMGEANKADSKQANEPSPKKEQKQPAVNNEVKLSSVESQIAYFERTGENPERLAELLEQRAELQSLINSAK